MSDVTEPSVQFVAKSIPTDDAYYIHFSDQSKDPTFYVLLRGQPHNFDVSIRAPRFGDLHESMGVKTCRLAPGELILQLDGSLLHLIEGSGKIRITFNENEYDTEEIRRQLIEIVGDSRLIAI